MSDNIRKCMINVCCQSIPLFLNLSQVNNLFRNWPNFWDYETQIAKERVQVSLV